MVLFEPVDTLLVVLLRIHFYSIEWRRRWTLVRRNVCGNQILIFLSQERSENLGRVKNGLKVLLMIPVSSNFSS